MSFKSVTGIKASSLIAILIFAIGCLYVGAGIESVDGGKEKVIYSWSGGILNDPLEEGTHWVEPFFKEVRAELSIQENIYKTNAVAGT